MLSLVWCVDSSLNLVLSENSNKMGNSQLCRCVCDSSCPNEKGQALAKDEEFLVGNVETRQQTVLKQKCEYIAQSFDSLKAEYDRERGGFCFRYFCEIEMNPISL